MKIKEIKSFEILDSRGSPTIATLIKSDEEIMEFYLEALSTYELHISSNHEAIIEHYNT